MVKKLINKEEGFTIIEVLIVLAIAGLILLIVFLAVPALQRNSRNTSRRSDASHLGGLLNEFATNNQGNFPTAIAAGTGATATTMYLGTESFAIVTATPTISACTAASCPAATTIDTLVAHTNAVCNVNTITYNASSRNAAISYLVESANGNVVQCTPV
jgi:prepilin-type N-terminal cleavage/methylation domain-containing protein